VTVKHNSFNNECLTAFASNSNCTIKTTNLPGSASDSYYVAGSGEPTFPKGMNAEPKEPANVHCFGIAHPAGIELGFEGTDPQTFYDPNLNKDGKGNHVLTVKMLEGQVMVSKGGKALATSQNGKPCKDAKPCNPGQLYQGAEMYIDVDNPIYDSEFPDAAPDVIGPTKDSGNDIDSAPNNDSGVINVQPPENGDDKGCGCSTPGDVETGTRSKLAMLLGLLGLVAAARRRR
jgi:MYXO-CTERM domain-containing protein